MGNNSSFIYIRHYVIHLVGGNENLHGRKRIWEESGKSAKNC